MKIQVALRKEFQTVSLRTMVQLIADSGSTKTDWRLVMTNREAIAFRTQGLNPYHHSDFSIQHILASEVLPYVKQQFDEIHFYGAGCSADENKRKMIACFKHFFPQAQVEVETDLLGAARALLGNSRGFIGILGTGSNTGIYDGQKITNSVDSLGWLLGDEGSGVHIGKEILRLWLRGNFFHDDESKLMQFCPSSRDEILNRIYHSLDRNQFLGSFAKFASENPSENMNSVVADCFNELIQRVIKLYDSNEFSELNFVGSVAWHFKDILKMVAGKHAYSTGKILQSPIHELMKYHSEKNR